jgi:hypothetical protein
MVVNSAVTGFPPDINAAFQYVVGDHGVNFFGGTAIIPADQMTETDMLAYRLAALRNQLAMFPNRDHCLKTHHACLVACNVPLIPRWLTKGAVYLVRDPRDIAVSMSKHMGQTMDEAIDFMSNEYAGITRDDVIWKHYLSTWSAHVESWLDERNPIKAVAIKYEDLVADPQTHFRRLLTGLGIYDVTERHLRRAIARCSIHYLRSQEDARGFGEKSKNSDKFFGTGDGWENVLTPEQVKRIESDHGSIMQELGYEIGVSYGTRHEPVQNAC